MPVQLEGRACSPPARLESSEAGRQDMKWDAPSPWPGGPLGGMSPRRAGSKSPFGSCQEKPLWNVLSTLLRLDDFHSAVAMLCPAGRVLLSHEGCPQVRDGDSSCPPGPRCHSVLGGGQGL